jgi:predicted flap endonuclease-1-like 5' DNA nuclease
MLFLLLQIFLLMVLAAACGVALAWWWFRRNYEDVTVYHEELVEGAKSAKDQPAPLTTEEFKAGLAGLAPPPDLSPLTERLARIESALSLTGSAGLGAINERFTEMRGLIGQTQETSREQLETRLGRMETLLQQPDDALEGVLGRLSDIESSLLSVSNEVASLQNTDLDPVEIRLAQLEELVRGQTMPEVDLGPVHSGLASLELALENLDIPKPDLEPVRTHMAAMESRLAEFADRMDTARKADVEELMIRMSTLSSSLAGLRVPDVDQVNARLGKIEAAIAPVSQIGDAVDRLGNIEEAVSRLDRIEAAVNSIDLPETDFTPIVNELRNIEGLLRAPSEDMRVVHTKLADIEGGSASLHSKLSGVEHTVAMLARSGVDLTPVQARLSNVESALASLRVELQSMPDFGPMERRLAALQDSMLAMREPDLSPVLSSMRKLDARLDMGAMDSRLASIEYTLAALNHILRARDFGYLRGEGEYTYRQPVYTPPRPEPPAFTPIDQVLPERTPKAPPVRPAEPEPEAAAEPESVSHPLEIALRPGDKANLLVEAAFGNEDDLEVINGIGPMLGELLNEIGVYYFWQIAEWGPAEIEWVDNKLEHFKGRIERDEWVAQAKELAKLPTSAKHPAGK